jgi:hypothetical protein
MMAPPDDLTFVGEADVRGKLERVRLWTLADLAHDARDAVAVAAAVPEG